MPRKGEKLSVPMEEALMHPGRLAGYHFLTPLGMPLSKRPVTKGHKTCLSTSNMKQTEFMAATDNRMYFENRSDVDTCSASC